MSIGPVVQQAQEYMSSKGVDGWLIYDYRGLNPILSDTVGRVGHVTRPVWLWIPVQGDPHMLVSFVDQSRFTHLGIDTTLFVNRQDMVAKLSSQLGPARRIAMEYTPEGALPRVSKVDRWYSRDGTTPGCGRGVVCGPAPVRYPALERRTARLSSIRRREADTDRRGGIRTHRVLA